MNAFILAAGQGSRLRTSIPKCLLEVNNEPLLERSLKCTKGIDSIIKSVVIIGNGGVWTRDTEGQALKIAHKYSAEIIVNKNSMETHSTESLKIALEEMKQSDDLLIIDGDLVYDEHIAKGLAQQEGSVLLVGEQHSRSGSKVKYEKNKSGQIILQEISESIQSEYVYLGMMKLGKNHVLIIKDLIEESKYKKDILAVILNDICKVIELRCLFLINDVAERVPYIQGNVININTKNDLENAGRIFNK